MAENDKQARGFLYYWANEEKTIKAIPPSEMIDDHPDQVNYGARVPVECYSRIVGYIRPLQQWNEGKQQEWAERKVYEVPEVTE